MRLLSRVWLLATPWTAAYQAPRPWDFPGKSTGVGCHCLLWNTQQITSKFFLISWPITLGFYDFLNSIYSHSMLFCSICSVMNSQEWFRETNAISREAQFYFITFHFHALEKDMATHSSVLAWRIPGTGEPGGLLSVGLHRVGHDWSNLAAAAAGTKQFGSKFSPSFKYKIRKSEKILCLYPGIKRKKKTGN